MSEPVQKRSRVEEEDEENKGLLFDALSKRLKEIQDQRNALEPSVRKNRLALGAGNADLLKEMVMKIAQDEDFNLSTMSTISRIVGHTMDDKLMPVWRYIFRKMVTVETFAEWSDEYGNMRPEKVELLDSLTPLENRQFVERHWKRAVEYLLMLKKPYLKRSFEIRKESLFAVGTPFGNFFVVVDFLEESQKPRFHFYDRENGAITRKFELNDERVRRVFSTFNATALVLEFETHVDLFYPNFNIDEREKLFDLEPRKYYEFEVSEAGFLTNVRDKTRFYDIRKRRFDYAIEPFLQGQYVIYWRSTGFLGFGDVKLEIYDSLTSKRTMLEITKPSVDCKIVLFNPKAKAVSLQTSAGLIVRYELNRELFDQRFKNMETFVLSPNGTKALCTMKGRPEVFILDLEIVPFRVTSQVTQGARQFWIEDNGEIILYDQLSECTVLIPKTMLVSSCISCNNAVPTIVEENNFSNAFCGTKCQANFHKK